MIAAIVWWKVHDRSVQRKGDEYLIKYEKMSDINKTYLMIINKHINYLAIIILRLLGI